MERKVEVECLTVSEVKTHCPFIVLGLSKWSQCCSACFFSPNLLSSPCWVQWARQWAAVSSARPRQASWMPLGVLKGPGSLHGMQWIRNLLRYWFMFRTLKNPKAISVVVFVSKTLKKKKFLCPYLLCSQDIQVNAHLWQIISVEFCI